MNNTKVAALCNNNNFNIIKQYFINNDVVLDIYPDYLELIDNLETHNIVLIDELYNEANVFQVCEVLSNTKKVPMIMLSSNDDLSYEKKAYDIGCVDYVPINNNLDILRRKIAVHCTKVSNDIGLKDVFELSDGVVFDIRNNHLKVDEEVVNLTGKQYKILKYLILNNEKIVSRQELVAEIWNEEVNNERVIDTHIKNIRKLIPKIRIDTISGGGYRYIKG
jgi:DNA-binding response OmpR family regulator